MKVRDEELIGCSQLYAQLKQPLSDATPAIDQQRLATGLHQHAGSEAVHHRRRAAGAKQCHPKVVAVGPALWPRVGGYRQSKETGYKRGTPGSPSGIYNFLLEPTQPSAQLLSEQP